MSETFILLCWAFLGVFIVFLMDCRGSAEHDRKFRESLDKQANYLLQGVVVINDITKAQQKEIDSLKEQIKSLKVSS